MVEARRLNSYSLLQSKVIDYVVNRQNADGGYTFCQGAESNAQDTYYGLAILRLLNSAPVHLEKTTAFLAETRLDSIYSIYYVTKAMQLLGGTLDEGLKKRIALATTGDRFFGSTDIFSEISSEFNTTYMTLELADLLKITLKADKIEQWLLSFKNEDGGFGTHHLSNLNSTYYAASSLNLLKSSLDWVHGTVEFVRTCEKPYGGFTVVPINFTPYMEQTYYGVMTLDLLGEKSRYPTQTAEWILKCQNMNGGFARSDLGISTFADTYYALRIMQKIEERGAGNDLS